MAKIDIAYLIVLYGVHEEGEKILTDNFKEKYDEAFIKKFLTFIKEKKKSVRELIEWKDIEKKKISNIEYNIKQISGHNHQVEYYSGNQVRLGHYFRHLYHSFKFLDKKLNLEEKTVVATEKAKGEVYEYGKILRGQLSTPEQALLFLNSISSIGMKWEFLAEKDKDEGEYLNLITKYQLIKNIPEGYIANVNCESYYPYVTFEYKE